MSESFSTRPGALRIQGDTRIFHKKINLFNIALVVHEMWLLI